MDSRLKTISGVRPERLTQQELPTLARCIVGYVRGLVQVHAGQSHDISYVLFRDNKGTIRSLVRGDDWHKILPYVKNGTFSAPPLPFNSWDQGSFNVGNIDVYDFAFYNRVLGVLRQLFPVAFPTSKL